MKARVALSLATIAGILVAGCANRGSGSSSESDQANAVASVIPAIDGGANSGNSQAGAISTRESIPSWLIHSAYASVGCGQFAVEDSCASGATGVRKAVYSNCSNWGGALTGGVTLTYSDAACAFGTVSGQTLTRTATLTRTGVLGGTVITDSTNSSTTYDGTALGAGSTLSYNGTNFSFAIAGIHKVRNLSTGTSVYDVNVETASPMTLTGALSGSRVVDGGTVVLYHNLAKFKASFTPHNLSYSSSTCCHPISGTIDVAYTGSISGSGTVTFPGGCGVAKLDFNNRVESVTLQGCE